MLISRIADPEIIAGFYEAAADPVCWSRTWAAICRLFDVQTGVLYYQPDTVSPPRILAAQNWSGASPGLFMGGFPGESGAGLQHGIHYRTIVGREVVTPHAIPSDDVYAAAFGRPFEAGTYHVLGASVPVEGAARAGLALQRPIGEPAFDEDDRAALDGMARHLAAALRLANMLESQRVSSTLRGAALDRLRHGAVIVDADGRVQFANDAARRMAEGGGLVLGEEGGRLSCANETEALRLAAIVRCAASGGTGGCTRISRGGRQPMLAAVVTPLPVDMTEEVDPEQEAPPLALVSIRDLGDTCDAAQMYLMELFGLTSAEAAILPQLLAGDSASLIAQSRGVQVATVRTQVARVLTKTGAVNLRALASMVAALG